MLVGLDGDWELILVDDGSRDRSFETMVELRASDPRVKVIELSRNFGHHGGVTSGLDPCVRRRRHRIVLVGIGVILLGR